jgi:chromosomal replication initiation ATPase DnaA
MGQVLSLTPAPSPRPLIIFGHALVMRLAQRTAELTGIPLSDIVGDRHKRPLAYARFAVALVANEHGKSLSLIGRIFHGRHHTTIRDGVHRARLLEASDPDFAELVRLLREEAAR